MKKEVLASELNLGDKVSLGDWAFSSATVVQIDDGVVHLVRPFVHIEDFVCAGNKVLNYLGTELVKIAVDDSRTVVLLEEGRPLK